jgi:pimeloyl-ACP methyl ester carboxylesterase
MRRVARNETNTFNKSGPPIILIPGIMGSRLEKKDNNNKDCGMIWNPDSTGFMLKLAAMHVVKRAELFNVKTTAVPCKQWSKPALEAGLTEDQCSRRWPELSWNFYGRGLQILQAQADLWDGKVYGFGYDWRQSNMKSGKSLAEFIKKVRRENKNKKILLVTHSMGGLVARAACKVHGAEGDVMGVVHTMQPAYGTPAAYGNFKMGAASGVRWVKGAAAFIKDEVLATIEGRSVAHFAIIAHGMPGLFELLPNQWMHDCMGNELQRPPGEHETVANSWLKVESDSGQLNSILASAKNIYGYYAEASGQTGLIDFEYWDSPENRYIADGATVIGHTAEGIIIGSRVPGMMGVGAIGGLAAGVVDLVHRISGPEVAEGVRAGIRAAVDFHVNQVKDYHHPNTCVIAGSGLEGDTGFHIRIKSEETFYERCTSPHSDGTVSLASATALRVGDSRTTCEKRQYGIEGVEHGGAFGENPPFMEKVWLACQQAMALAPKD